MIKKFRPLFIALSILLCTLPVLALQGHDFYQLKIYHLKNDVQVTMVDGYLKNVYIPALHRQHISNIGVFKPIANDTSAVKSIYVLIPFDAEQAWIKLDKALEGDRVYIAAASEFIAAPGDAPPYERMESIIMEAFPGQRHLLLPATKNTTRVFEMRSYESPTEHLFKKKMAMFNKDEIKIFNRLAFNPVFYGQVISGSHMPNLMYMPVFNSVQERDGQWKAFGNDAKWKEISADPANENKVSVNHIDSILMHAASYSDY